MNQDEIALFLKNRVPTLLAVYIFGSQVTGQATSNSDYDIAVFSAGKIPVVTLFDLSNELAIQLHREVDLVDFCAASTVMQYQIIMTGHRIWQKDQQAALYEAAILSEKTELDTHRARLLKEIYQRGSIYG